MSRRTTFGREKEDLGADMTTEPTSYSNVPALAQLYLEDSFILDVLSDDQGLRFKVDLVLSPGHLSYHEPRQGEKYCYEQGWISIAHPRSVHWIRRTMRPFRDASDEIDFGSIDSWQVDGDITHIEGNWGEVEVAGGIVSVSLEQ